MITLILTMLEVVALSIGTILLVRGTSTISFLINSLSWFKKNYKEIKHIHGKLPRVTLIIPALREQKRIVATLDYFLKSFEKYPIKIVVVTTQREFEKSFVGLSTHDLTKKYIEDNHLSDKISLIDYPKLYGRKAHQLNFVLNKLKNSTDFVAFYDADSRPHQSTFDAFYHQVYLYPQAEVFQQSALFISNYQQIDNIFLRASAILQSRWTLAHEIARLLRQSKNETFISRFANAHCVGHGLIIKLNTLNKIGGFCEKTMNEDLILGYLLRINGIKIFPLPCLELADAPTTIRGLWTQKYVWFWGPLRYLEYYKFACKEFKFDLRNKIKAMVIASQGLISALAWLLSGPIFLAAIVLLIITDNFILKIILLSGIILYGPLQFWITVNNFDKYQTWSGQKLKKQKRQEVIIISIMSIPAIIFNSIPPYFALVSEIKYRLHGQEIYKPKTDD